MIQWHPLFAHLLRGLVEDYYAVETNVPVGDLPREADILLVRRTSAAPPPFTGVWSHLTQWNILEFKGPSDDPALRDLDLLLEIGLGIDRRLNEQRARDRLSVLERAEVSFWYIANHLGRRFLAEAEDLFGASEQLNEGLWRCGCARRAVFLVSRDTMPVEPETVPLHLVCSEPESVRLRLAEVVLTQPGWWHRYGSSCCYSTHSSNRRSIVWHKPAECRTKNNYSTGSRRLARSKYCASSAPRSACLNLCGSSASNRSSTPSAVSP